MSSRDHRSQDPTARPNLDAQLPSSASKLPRWAAISALGLAIIAGGVAKFEHASAREGDASQASDSLGERAPKARGRGFAARGVETQAGRCSFLPGERMAYAVVTSSDLDLDFSPLSQGVDLGKQGAGGQAGLSTTEAQTRSLERRWTIELEALALGDDGASVLAARIDDEGVVGEGSSFNANVDLSPTFLIRVDGRCAIQEFGWRSEGKLDAAREQQLLALGLSFWAPERADSDAAWTGGGVDGTGRYEARYRLAEGGQRVRGEWVKQQVRASAVRGKLAVSAEVRESAIDVELADDAWFERADQGRTLSLSVAGVEVGTHASRTQARRVAVDAGPQASLTAELPAVDDPGWSWGTLLHQRSAAAPAADAELVGVPAAEALTHYRELIAQRRSVAEYGVYLQGWLRANPEGAGVLLAQLRAGAFDDEDNARSGLFFALGTAQTAGARGALVDLLGSPDDATAHRISAAHAMAMVATPEPRMLELMATAATDPSLHPVERGSMTLALGAFARGAEASDPALAAEARATIDGWLAQPEDDEQLRRSILAAGNAGHDGLVESVAPYFDHEDPTVRGSAAHAMRQMSPELAFPHLGDSLRDEDSRVRARALASATAISRSHEQAPPSAMVESAARALDGAGQAEQRALLSFLRVAAEQGDAGAKAALQDRLDLELSAARRDRQRLAALGRSVPGHWQAD